MELPTNTLTSPIIAVSNIPLGKNNQAITVDSLLGLFVPFGAIASINYTTNLPAARITYEEVGDAKEAVLNMNGFAYFGKYLRVVEHVEEVAKEEERWIQGRAVWDQDQGEENNTPELAVTTGKTDIEI